MTASARRLPFLLLLVLAHSVRAGDGVQLAPAPRAGAPAGASAPALVEDLSWKLCEVTASVLATAPGRSLVASERTELIYLGESLDVEADVTVPLPAGTAMVHARAKVRSAAATDDGVTLFVSSDGIMRSTIGFQHPETGKDQFRSEMLLVSDEGTRLHEIYAMPDIELRVVMVLRTRPMRGRQEPSAWDMVSPPTGGVLRRFRVEAFLKEGDTLQQLEKASLQALDGGSARLALTRFSTALEGGRPVGMPGSTTVRYISMPGAPTKSAEEMGALTPVPADARFQRRVEDLQRSITLQPTVDLGRKLEGQLDVPGTPRKISQRKKRKLQEQIKQQEIRQWAIDRSKTLPDVEGEPTPDRREELVLTLTPLRATRESVQLEVQLRGRVKLPGEEEPTRVDATMVEQVRFGEALELGIAELVREDEPSYDYVLRITSER